MILWPAVGGVTHTHVGLRELSLLQCGVVTREVRQSPAVIVIVLVHRQTESLVDVADLGCHVVAGLVLPYEAVETLQSTARSGGVGGGSAAVRFVTHLGVVTQTEGPVVTAVVPAVFPLVEAARLVELPIVVTIMLDTLSSQGYSGALPEVVTSGRGEAVVTVQDHAGGLLWPAGLALPVVLGQGAVPLQAVVAGESLVRCRHVGWRLSGEVLVETEVVAEVLLAEADSVVQTVTEHAVLAHLSNRSVQLYSVLVLPRSP